MKIGFSTGFFVTPRDKFVSCVFGGKERKEGVDSRGVGAAGAGVQLYHVLAVCVWRQSLASLGLRYFICD